MSHKRSGLNGDAEFEDVSECGNCGANNFSTKMSTLDYESGYGIFTLLSCNSCNTLVTNPAPKENSISKLYIERSSTDFVEDRKLTKYLRNFATRRFLKTFVKTDYRKNLSLLDFGCGDGQISLVASKLCEFGTVLAVDFMNTPPKTLVNTNILYASYDELSTGSTMKSFDVIVCKHVLEHVLHPRSFIRELSQSLNPGGQLIFEVPNADSIWMQIFRGAYHGIYAPRHTYQFSARSFDLVQQEFLNVEIRKGSTPTIGKSLGNILGYKISNTGIIGLMLYPIQILFELVSRSSSTLVVKITN